MEWPEILGPHGAVFSWLNLVFGTWVGGLSGADLQNAEQYTLLTRVIGWSNLAALVLAVILTVYHGKAILVQSADSGQGNKMSNWFFVRVAIAFLMILPIAGGSLSPIQKLTMQVSVWGTRLADTVWEFAVDEALVLPEIKSTTTGVAGLAQQLLRAQVCALGIIQHSGQTNQENQQLSATYGTTPIPLSTSSMPVQNTGGDTNSGRFADLVIDERVTQLEFGPGGICGEFRPLMYTDETGNDVFARMQNSSNTYTREAMANLIRNLSPIAEEIIELGGYKISDDSSASTQNRVQTMVTQYQNAVTQYVTDLNASAQSLDSNDTFSDNFKQFIKSEGWGLAAIWWPRLAEYQTIFSKVAQNQASKVLVKRMPICDDQKGVLLSWFISQKDCVTKENYASYLKGTQAVIEQAADGLADARVPSEIALSANLEQACSNKNCSGNEIESVTSNYIFNVIWAGAKEMSWFSSVNSMDSENAYTTSGLTSPFMLMSQMGNGLYNLGGVVVLTAGFAKAIGGAAIAGGSGALQSLFLFGLAGFGYATLAFATWLWFLGVLMQSVGFTMAYVIPFIPSFLWSLVVIGFFIMMVQAMVAAPLGVAMLCVPDRQFLGGQVMRTVMRIAAVLFRPFLAVVGLIAATAVGYIGFAVFNTIFFLTMSYVGGGLFLWILIFTLYCYCIIKIMRLCYNVIHDLSDKVLESISGAQGNVSSFGEVEASREETKDIMPPGQVVEEVSQRARQGRMDSERHRARRLDAPEDDRDET